MEFWFTEHSMQALRRHRKHSVISCRLAARWSTCAGSLQASSTAREDFFRMSSTLWKIVLGAVSLKKDTTVTNRGGEKSLICNVLFGRCLYSSRGGGSQACLFQRLDVPRAGRGAVLSRLPHVSSFNSALT